MLAMAFQVQVIKPIRYFGSLMRSTMTRHRLDINKVLKGQEILKISTRILFP